MEKRYAKMLPDVSKAEKRNGQAEIHEHHNNNSKSAETDIIAFDHKLYALGRDENGSVNVYRITVEKNQSKRNTNVRQLHNLKYIEKAAKVSADALAEKSRSGGSATLTTNFSISYILVK